MLMFLGMLFECKVITTYLNAGDKSDFPAVIIGLTTKNIKVMEVNVSNPLFTQTSEYIRYFFNLIQSQSPVNVDHQLGDDSSTTKSYRLYQKWGECIYVWRRRYR